MPSVTEDSQRVIRRDGKPARKPRLGTPPGTPRPSAGAVGRAPEWHELVQAPDTRNRPNKARSLARREERGQARPDTRVTLAPSTVKHGRQQHGVPVRSWPMFGLVLHRTRMTARSGGGIDRSVPTAAAIENRRARKVAKAMFR